VGRLAALLLLAGCGRIGFGVSSVGPDASSDVAIDAPGLPSGLVAWFQLDDPAGTTFVDSLGGPAGSCTAGTCPTPTAGHLGGAFLFDGVSSCISVPDAGQLAMTQAQVTIAIWARQDALQPASQVMKRVDVGANTEDSWELETLLADGTMSFIDARNTGNLTTQSAPGAIVLGTWQHLAGSFDGTMTRLYVGGALVAMRTDARQVMYDTHEMRIGCDDNGTGGIDGLFAGALDDVQIYDRALSDAEIAMLAAR
jgi:hypothetical protein